MRPLRSGILLLLPVLALGCNGNSPTDPSPQTRPPAANTAILYGYVHDESGACVRDAVVEVLDGPRAGAKATQPGPCGIWDYDDRFYYSFSGLAADANVRLRASKAGYQSREVTLFATNNPTRQTDILLVRE